jgi:hypothetical protein
MLRRAEGTRVSHQEGGRFAWSDVRAAKVRRDRRCVRTSSGMAPRAASPRPGSASASASRSAPAPPGVIGLRTTLIAGRSRATTLGLGDETLQRPARPPRAGVRRRARPQAPLAPSRSCRRDLGFPRWPRSPRASRPRPIWAPPSRRARRCDRPKVWSHLRRLDPPAKCRASAGKVSLDHGALERVRLAHMESRCRPLLSRSSGSATG